MVKVKALPTLLTGTSLPSAVCTVISAMVSSAVTTMPLPSSAFAALSFTACGAVIL